MKTVTIIFTKPQNLIAEFLYADIGFELETTEERAKQLIDLGVARLKQKDEKTAESEQVK